MAAVKNKKLRYLGNLLTDFDEICLDDAYWLSGYYRAKHPNFKNARWHIEPFSAL